MTLDDAMLTREVLLPLRDRPLSVHDADVLDARRERALPALRALVREVPRRRARRRLQLVLAVALPAAAAVALAAGWSQLGPAPAGSIAESSSPPAVEPASSLLHVSATTGSVVHRTAQGSFTLAAGTAEDLPARGQLVTGPGASARVERDGFEVTLQEATEISIDAAALALRSVRLTRGSVRCVVPPLGNDRDFSVVTPDATVVVHGTVFDVRVEPDTQQTCVHVEEGVVSVRHAGGKVWLEAGDTWGCNVIEEVDPPPAASGRAKASREVPLEEGTLAAENALFQAALAAERQGDRPTAVARLRDLLAKYPSSPLAPEARAMLARL